MAAQLTVLKQYQRTAAFPCPPPPLWSYINLGGREGQSGGKQTEFHCNKDSDLNAPVLFGKLLAGCDFVRNRVWMKPWRKKKSEVFFLPTDFKPRQVRRQLCRSCDHVVCSVKKRPIRNKDSYVRVNVPMFTLFKKQDYFCFALSSQTCTILLWIITLHLSVMCKDISNTVSQFTLSS